MSETEVSEGPVRGKERGDVVKYGERGRDRQTDTTVLVEQGCTNVETGQLT